MNLFRPCVQLAILLCIVLVTPLSANTVEQLFMTFEKKEHDWSIKITFDAGYALPGASRRCNIPTTSTRQKAWEPYAESSSISLYRTGTMKTLL
jgi:hypothetical protein